MTHRSIAFAVAALSAFVATAAFAAAPAPAAPPAAGAAPAAPAAPLPPATNYRGTIVSFDAATKTLTVKTREGATVTLAVPDTVNVGVHKAFVAADIKAGNNLAVTTIKGPNNTNIALNIRPLPATAQPNIFDYDLQPGSVMNNLPVETVGAASATGQSITLKTPTGGTLVAMIVPGTTTMSQNTPGTRDDLKAGAAVFAAGRPDAAGKMTLTRLEVGKDGVNPGM